MKVIRGQKRKILFVLDSARQPLTPKQILDEDSEILEAGIYVALARMRADGLLTSQKDESTGGARGSPHRRYEISGFGRRVLALSNEAESGIHSDLIGSPKWSPSGT